MVRLLQKVTLPCGLGDWAWNYIKDSASADDEFGLMPCPLTGKEDDAVNTELGVFCSKGYCIDASQNSEEQQEAGKKLVEFFCVEKAQEMSDLWIWHCRSVKWMFLMIIRWLLLRRIILRTEQYPVPMHSAVSCRQISGQKTELLCSSILLV